MNAAQAREFIERYGDTLAEIGDSCEGWTVVASDYNRHKHSDVYFTVVVADPEGQLWQYELRDNHSYGAEVASEPIPVEAVVEVKQAVSFKPRLVARDQGASTP